jgi:uncharacterized protein (TIGR00251 family)
MPLDLPIRVQPRAGRDELAGMRAGRLLVRVTAPPLEGRANAAACALIAKAAGVPKSRVSVIQGEHARDKLVRIDAPLDEPAARAALGMG